MLLSALAQLSACLIVWNFHIPNPNIVLFVVLSAVLVKCGYAAGIVSGLIAFLYSAFFFSTDHSFFLYTSLNLQKLIVIGLGIVANILLIGHLQRQFERSNMEKMQAETEEKLQETTESYRAKLYRDVLTGTYNRRYYEDIASRIVGPAGIALMDVDDFKICNDTYGHHAGDVALEAAANAIRSCIRSSDLLIRYGGDEFLLVLLGIPSNILQTKLEQIRAAVQQATVPGYSHFRLSLSIGGTMQAITDSMENAVRRADRLMYQAKCRKNAVTVELPENALTAQEELVEEKPQILLVDDSEMNRLILAEILQGDYRILEAKDGRECMDALQAEAGNLALVLLDINMPVMDGFEVLKAMNANHTIEDIPVIMISSDDSDAAIRRSYELGASDYVNRPFDARIVYRRVTNTIKLYAKQRRLVQMVSDQIRARENNTDMLVGVLSHIVEFRNGESGAHVRHIRIITELLLHRLLEISSQYPITAEQQDNIPLASALHDIGKIGIDEKILNKPGKLTPEEFEVVKTHSMLGAEMLHQLENFNEQPLLQTAYEITRWHHERWDGHGYPDGLMGEEIPISAQIVAIADVYDALTSERCYKKAYDHTTAINMILNGECGAFNPLLLECLTETAEQLHIVAGVNGDVMPYRFEQNRLSEEILAHADLPKNDRVQNLLDTMQERIDFFASTSGGIQFEYDAVSRLADVTNWNEPPQYRHSVKNVTRVNDFRYLSQKDFKRLRDAMDATTKETPEFSMSILFPVGNEYHWCDLRVRTLWSDLRPDHYIAAVGQLLDPQMKEEKDFPSQVSPLDSDSPVILQSIRCLQSVFDIVRLVDPTTYEVLALDEAGVLRHSKQHCAAFWDNDGTCANCTSARAYAQKSTLNKLEFTSTDVYFVVSKYLNLNGTPCVLELLSRLDEGRWIDANGTRLLLDRNRDGNMDLFLDPVTNTYSRRYYETYRAHLEGMESIAIIDANRFKQVNDSFGHPAGDAVLQEIARAIQACIRKTDILIRYGGDEFLLLFPKMSEEILERKMQEISKAVEDIRIADYPELRLSISIGGVTGVHPITEAIRQADLRMYAQKQAYNQEHQLDN